MVENKCKWKMFSLNNLIEIKHGFGFKGEYFSELDNRFVVVTPGNFKIGGGFQNQIKMFYCSNYPNQYNLKQGDLIVTMTDLSKESDTLGAPAIIPKDNYQYLHNQRIGLVKIKNTDKIDQKFLYYILRSEDYHKLVVSTAAGSTVKHTSPSRIKEYKFLNPPMSEQIKIAEALSDIDNLILSLEKLIEKKKAIKQGIMQKLLTGKTRLSGFSDDWKKLKLGDILSVGHGQNQKRIEIENGKYKILATGGCIGYTDEFLWNKPSVLIGRKGTIDKPQYVDEPFWTIDTLFYTKIKEGYSARCLFYYMQMIDWMNYNEASGVPSLSAKIIEKIEICIPKYDEQCEIAKTIDSMDSEIVSLESKLSKYRQIKQGMMQELLTGRIRLL